MMKYFVWMATVVALAQALNYGDDRKIDVNINFGKNSNAYHKGQFQEGSFKYGLNVEKKDDSHFQHKVKGPDDVTYGCYGFVDPDGQSHAVFYVSDLRGFRHVIKDAPTKVYASRLEANINDEYQAPQGKTIEWKDLFFPLACNATSETPEVPATTMRPPPNRPSPPPPVTPTPAPPTTPTTPRKPETPPPTTPTTPRVPKIRQPPVTPSTPRSPKTPEPPVTPYTPPPTTPTTPRSPETPPPTTPTTPRVPKIRQPPVTPNTPPPTTPKPSLKINTTTKPPGTGRCPSVEPPIVATPDPACSKVCGELKDELKDIKAKLNTLLDTLAKKPNGGTGGNGTKFAYFPVMLSDGLPDGVDASSSKFAFPAVPQQCGKN